MNDAGESAFRWMPIQASSVAGDVDRLYAFTMGASIFISALVALLVVVFCVRYRRGRRDHLRAPSSNTKLEVGFLSALTVLFLAMFVWAAQVYARLMIPDEPVERVFVVAKQWMWKLQYSNGHRTINELTAPLDRAIELVMSSQDVIHSFYVPAFRVKHDVLPFRYTRIWFKATRLGTYHLFCTEYCGAEHSRMVGRVRVVSAQEFARWLGDAPIESSAQARGRALFDRMACISCHEPRRRIGPALEGLFGETVLLSDGSTALADEDYLRRSILEPHTQIRSGFKPIMPAYAGRLDEEELWTLLEYLKQLRSGSDVER
jgi:cytochrome c oxidase subunit 2